MTARIPAGKIAVSVVAALSYSGGMLRWRWVLWLIGLPLWAEPLEEWRPYAKTGLFPSDSPLWLAPDMEKEPIPAFTARMLDGARNADTKAMATLGRFFFVRGDPGRASEWLGKAAFAGHPGAQLDYGLMRLRGLAAPASSIEAYAWLWLATRGEAPGAEEAFRQALKGFSMGEVIAGTKLVVVLEEGMPAAGARATQR